MKILFVAFEFPPLGGAGVQRSLHFARYLPEFGIEPVVVTTDGDSFRGISKLPVDEKLLLEIPDGLEIERIPCPRTSAEGRSRVALWARTFFSLVEPQAKYWTPQVLRIFRDLLRKHRPAAIYVTLPPFSMAPMWCNIARKFGIPLVLDFRDAWSQWQMRPYASWLHYKLTLRLERKCLETASRVICSSEQTRTDLLRVHRGIPPEKLTVITNGYDRDVTEWTMAPLQTEQPAFTIGYIGHFYYSPDARKAMMTPWWKQRPNRWLQYTARKEDWLYRSPYFFFKAVAHLLREHPEWKTRLRLRFAGTYPDWMGAQVDEFDLHDIVEFLGYLDHPRVLALQEECDALLVTSSKVIGGRDYSIAGKTFEYLSMKKPIIGFVTEGAQKDILVKSGMAVVCDPDSPSESMRKLLELMTGKTELNPNAPWLAQLHRRELSGRLGRIVREAARA